MNEPIFNNDRYIEMLRIERDSLLYDTDKYLLSDYPITQEKLNIIKNYRQELRNFNNTSNNILLPKPPDFITNKFIGYNNSGNNGRLIYMYNKN